MDAHAVVTTGVSFAAAPCEERSATSPQSAVEVAETWSHTATIEWVKLATESADIWIATDNAPGDYSYGGTRLIPFHTSDEAVMEQLEHLVLCESALKNRLINRVLREPEHLLRQENWSAAFWNSKVGGARCLIRPRDAAIEIILSDPEHAQFVETIRPLLRRVGPVLDACKGRIKLTPDFGHFAGISDLLYEATEHTLGISRELGGCGGKTRYSSYGVLVALEQLGALADKRMPVTLIGSAGAMGSDILRALLAANFDDIAVCDLKYQDTNVSPHPHVQLLPAQPGRFTDACLKRGGLLVATTIGQELENSNWQLIPPGTRFFLAHNLSVPANEQGTELMRRLQAQGVLAFPGQMLTLGGALTSRMEWFFRQQRTPEQLFDKPAAYATIKEVLQTLAYEITQLAQADSMTPYEAMLMYAE